MQIFKQFVSKLPNRWQIELKRLHYARQIKKNRFVTDEPEYKILHRLINPGDWVIDVGANVGHYTKKFSELVGPQGRVIALEPIPITFSLLSANTLMFTYPNVTLINAAASNESGVVYMSIPKAPTGLTDYYQAHISSDVENTLMVFAISLDSLNIDHPIALVKIDVEGHEASVLAGMRNLIEAWHPVLIVETGSQEVISHLKELGYSAERLKNSPNVLFKPKV